MNPVFKNSGNSKTSDTHRLLLNLSDKINLKRIDKYVALYIFDKDLLYQSVYYK